MGGNIEQNLGPIVRGPVGPSAGLWSYIDVYDLADALVLAAESALPGHKVLYIASPDNVAGRPLAELMREHHGDAIELREHGRPDASGISIAKARRLLGYDPSRSWRDYLDDDGHLRADVRERLERLERGETGVQAGRVADGGWPRRPRRRPRRALAPAPRTAWR